MRHPALTPGSRASQCAVCSEVFNSPAGFDKHRVGHIDEGRRCLTVIEMIADGMSKNDRGLWITAVYDREVSA